MDAHLHRRVFGSSGFIRPRASTPSCLDVRTLRLHRRVRVSAIVGGSGTESCRAVDRTGSNLPGCPHVEGNAGECRSIQRVAQKGDTDGLGRSVRASEVPRLVWPAPPLSWRAPVTPEFLKEPVDGDSDTMIDRRY